MRKKDTEGDSMTTTMKGKMIEIGTDESGKEYVTMKFKFSREEKDLFDLLIEAYKKNTAIYIAFRGIDNSMTLDGEFDGAKAKG